MEKEGKMIRILLILFLLLSGRADAAVGFDHSGWDNMLKQSVHSISSGRASQVDYDWFKKHEAELDLYLGALSQVAINQFDSWSNDEQLAFLINAYNSWTVKLILTKYPDLESIKDLGSFFSSPWKKRFIPLLGEERSLDDIEHKLIRGSSRYNDWRIHFAVNCASIGCPALQREAYTGQRLQLQLEDATKRFLEDKSRNRIEGGRAQISSIFKWYREDFEKGDRGIGALEDVLLRYAPQLDLTLEQRRKLEKREMKIDFLRYDWRLNRLEE